MNMPNVGLIEKITKLPPERMTEVENFVDFLSGKESRQHAESDDGSLGTINLRDLGISAEDAAQQRAALSSFAEDWERPEMEVYDKL